MEFWDQSFERAYIKLCDLPSAEREAHPPTNNRGLTDVQARALEFVQANPGAFTADVQAVTRQLPRDVRKLMSRLQVRGLVRRTLVPHSHGAPKARWWPV